MTEVADIAKDPKAGELVRAASDARSRALAIQVRSPREYEQVSEFRKSVKAKFNEIEGHRKYLKEPYLEGGRRVDEFFAPPLQALKEAEDTAKKHLVAYEDEQRRLAAEEQRRLDAEARAAREALEAKATAEREAADKAAAELERQAAAARDAGDLHTAVTLRHQANELVEASEIEVEATLSVAAAVVAPKVEAQVPIVAGQYTKKKWKGRVIDKKALPEEYKLVNEKMVNDYAQATEGTVSLAGVEFYSETVMSGRAK